MYLYTTAGLESREYGRRYPPRWRRGTLYPQKLELTSSTSRGRSISIVRSRTQATEFSFLFVYHRYRRLCDLMFRVPGYGSRSPRFDSRRYQIFWKAMVLERGTLSLMITIEELPEKKNI
jgi:hypothetical protein